MDIELTADNWLNYMGDDNPNEDQLQGEAMLFQHMEDIRKEKDSKKETRYFEA